MVDTISCRFEVPPEKAVAVAAKARILRSSHGVVARELARFCGLGISLYLAFPLARLFLQSLYSVLRTKRSWRDQLRLTPRARLDLETWENLWKCAGRPFNPDSVPFAGTLATDASLTGWGATFSPPGAAQP